MGNPQSVLPDDNDSALIHVYPSANPSLPESLPG